MYQCTVVVYVVWHNHQSMPHKVQQLGLCARGYTTPYVLSQYTNTKDQYTCSSVASGAQLREYATQVPKISLLCRRLLTKYCSHTCYNFLFQNTRSRLLYDFMLHVYTQTHMYQCTVVV